MNIPMNVKKPLHTSELEGMNRSRGGGSLQSVCAGLAGRTASRQSQARPPSPLQDPALRPGQAPRLCKKDPPWSTRPPVEPF